MAWVATMLDATSPFIITEAEVSSHEDSIANNTTESDIEINSESQRYSEEIRNET